MGDEECPFCGSTDPYDWADSDEMLQYPNVTVTCCTAGHGLFALEIPKLEKAAELLHSEDTWDIEKGREIVREYELEV